MCRLRNLSGKNAIFNCMVITDFNNELTLSFNRICFSSDFKIYFSSRNARTPNGLTIGVSGDSKNDYQLYLDIRLYGYDHSFNNGISKYTDGYDFYTEYFEFTDEHLNTVVEYFKTRKPDFYNEYMLNVPIYKSEREMNKAMQETDDK